MSYISDDNGVDVIMSPVRDTDGVQVNLEFNKPLKAVEASNNLTKDWNVEFRSGRELVGAAKFSAYQFIADGVERRTVALRYMELAPQKRGQKKSYDLARAILATVAAECDPAWGPVYGGPVLFIEKRDLQRIPEKDRDGIFGLLRKIAEVIFGFDHYPHFSPGNDLVVSPIGDDVSIQLIQGHLTRSAKAEDR